MVGSSFQILRGKKGSRHSTPFCKAAFQDGELEGPRLYSCLFILTSVFLCFETLWQSQAWNVPVTTPVTVQTCFMYLFFCPPPPLRATPMAYGRSQARGQIRATDASLRHSNARSEPHLQPTPLLMVTPKLTCLSRCHTFCSVRTCSIMSGYLMLFSNSYLWIK